MSIFVNDNTKWTQGWTTGDTLRFAFTNPMALVILAKNVEELVRGGLPPDAAEIAVQHNLTRGLIELICTSARKLGFNAIFGHEVDRHSEAGTIARPWLAVLDANVLTPPDWLRKPRAAV